MVFFLLVCEKFRKPFSFSLILFFESKHNNYLQIWKENEKPTMYYRRRDFNFTSQQHSVKSSGNRLRKINI